MDDTFVFRWPSDTAHAAFHKNGFQRLAELRERGELCDVALVPTVEDGMELEEVLAHKPVLAVSSPYFGAMFDAQTGMQVTTSKRVQIQMSREILLAIVCFFYTGVLSIGVEAVWDLVDAATYFHLDIVKQQCAEYLVSTLCAHNCLELLSLADKYALSSLKTAAWKYACDHFRVVAKSLAFLDFSVDALLELIAADELCVLREEIVYQAAMRWVRADEPARKKHLPSSWWRRSRKSR